MKFSEIIDQASALLQRKGRLTYRSLKLEFDLGEDRLDVLKEELIEGQRVAVDEDGKVLIWKGDPTSPEGISPLAEQTVTPSARLQIPEAERRQAAGVQQRLPYQEAADLDRFLAALRTAGLK